MNDQLSIEEEDRASKNPLLPTQDIKTGNTNLNSSSFAKDINVGNLAASGFDYPQIEAETGAQTKLRETVERTSPIEVENLTTSENDNTLISPEGVYGFNPGLDLTPEETQVWSAAWHNSDWGLTTDAIRKFWVDNTPDPDYDVLKDIPDEFLNENDFQYYVTSRNSAESNLITENLRREKADRASIEESPWQYFGASIATGLISPTTWLFQGPVIKNAATAWEAAGKAIIARDLARIAIGSGVAGVQQQITQEIVKHQGQEMVTAAESAWDVVTNGLVSAAFGTLIPAGIAAWQMRNLKSALTNVMATGADGPAMVVNNKSFKMPGYEEVGGFTGTYEADTSIKMKGFLPGYQNTFKISPPGRLATSESGAANFAAHDLFTLGYKTTAQVEENLASPMNAQAAITQYYGLFNAKMNEVSSIFREQFGVISGPFQGIRTRIANSKASGDILNVDQFALAVSEVMDTGVQHPTNGFVNRAAKVMQDKLFKPVKELLVESNQMPSYFLDPAFDNYFTRMWRKHTIAQNPDNFKALLKAWFQECNNYYKSFAPQIKLLHDPVLAIQKQLDMTKKKLSLGRQGPEYQLRKQEKLLAKEAFKKQRDLFKRERKFVKEATQVTQKEIDKLSKLKGLTPEQKAQLKSKSTLVKEFENTILSQNKARELLKEIEKLEALQKPTGKERVRLNTLQRQFSEAVLSLENEPSKVGARKILISEIEALERLPGPTKSDKSKLKTKKKQLKDFEEHTKKIDDDFVLAEQKIKEKVSEKNTAIPELKSKLEQLKKDLKAAQDNLYNYIPKKYLTPDGHIPSEKLDVQLDEAVEQTLDRLLGVDIDSLFSPIGSIGAKSSVDVMQLRALTIPLEFTTRVRNADGTYKLIATKDFLSRDIWKMAENYSRATSSRVVLGMMAKRKGLPDIAALKNYYSEGIQADYRKMRVGKSGAEAERINDMNKSDLQSLKDGFSILEERAGRATTPFGTGLARWTSRFKQYNMLRLLGSAAATALADPVNSMLRQGFFNTFDTWFPNMVKKYVSFGLLKGTASFEENKAALQALGLGLKTQLGMMQKSILDEPHSLVKANWWRGLVESTTDTFGNLTGMNQLQDFSEIMGGHLSIDNTFRILSNKFEKGIYKERDRIRMRNIGISEDMEKVLYDMWKETKDRKLGGGYVSNYDQYKIDTPERAHALEQFKNSIIVDIDRSTLLASAADKPVSSYGAMYKLVFEFKDWMLAANNRILGPLQQNLYYKEYDTVLSLATMVGVGMLSYLVTSLIKNPAEMPDLSMDNLLREGVDRAGIFGIFSDPINILQKNGVIPGKTVSRYRDRGNIGSVVGPTIGTPFDLLYNAGQMRMGLSGEIDYSTKQTKQLLQLWPYQNLWATRSTMEEIFQSSAVALGATDKRD